MDTCSNCIRARICYILEDDKGWCDECNKCREKNCEKSVVNRVYWTVSCENNPITLYRDVCEEHTTSTPSGCSCSQTAREKRVVPFVYTKNSTNVD